jgi:hypothetical protein
MYHSLSLSLSHTHTHTQILPFYLHVQLSNIYSTSSLYPTPHNDHRTISLRHIHAWPPIFLPSSPSHRPKLIHRHLVLRFEFLAQAFDACSAHAAVILAIRKCKSVTQLVRAGHCVGGCVWLECGVGMGDFCRDSLSIEEDG